MRVGRRQAIVGGALVVGGCGSGAAPSGSTADAAAPPPPLLGGGIVPPRDAATTPSSCATAVFEAQRVIHSRPAARTLYTWTTPEQIAELRAGGPLFARTERPGLGPGYAMDVIAAIARDGAPGSDEKRTAEVLSGDGFAKARYAWPYPWATRMGWPGETYGNQLLRIDLRPEAFIVTLRSGRFGAVDLENAPVALSAVLAEPQRIGAVYFVKEDVRRGCPAGYSTFGTFECASGDGYRELIAGNIAMVAEWSHSTEAIVRELEAERALLRAFAAAVISEERLPSVNEWNAKVVESWTSGAECGELAAYYDALALPSPHYLPTKAGLATVIETLGGDLFAPDPLVVRPNG